MNREKSHARLPSFPSANILQNCSANNNLDMDINTVKMQNILLTTQVSLLYPSFLSPVN